MYYYSRSLANARFLMVNSSWTKNHIDSLLHYKDTLVQALHFLPPLIFFSLSTNLHPNQLDEARIVYPPCDTREMAKLALQGREHVILSIAQFRYDPLHQCDIPFVNSGIPRPEKDHATQLMAFHRLLKAQPDYVEKGTGVKLVLLGGSRNSGDEARVEGLRRLARDLGIEAGPSQLNSEPPFLIVTCPLIAESCSIYCQCAVSRNAHLALSSEYWAQHHG